MKAFALLKDSFRETLDCKTLWVLAVISTILILLCLSVSFELLSAEEALRDMTRGFHKFVVQGPGGQPRAGSDPAVKFEAEDVRSVADGRYELRIKVAPAAAFHKLVRRWDAMRRGRIKDSTDAVPDGDVPASFELQRSYIVNSLRLHLLTDTRVEEGPADQALAYQVSLRPERLDLLSGAYRFGILFGIAHWRLPISPAMLVLWIQGLLATFIAGGIGVIFAVIVTASFVPDMLQKGRVDILVSKPIGRPALLALKYGGGLLFVLFNAIYLIGGCWLALALRSGRWDPSFLYSILVLTFFFGVLYSFSVWIGVLTRSAIASIAATFGLWASCFGIGLARRSVEGGGWEEWPARIVNAVYYVLPKTSDMDAINAYVLAKANLGPEAVSFLPGFRAAGLDWTLIFGSSAAFLVFFLALSCIAFSRRDY